jgi:hypothetical protein
VKSKTKTRNGNLERQLGNTYTQIKDIQNDLSTKRQSLLAAQQVHLLIFTYWEPAESIICVWFSSLVLFSRRIRSRPKNCYWELITSRIWWNDITNKRKSLTKSQSEETKEYGEEMSRILRELGRMKRNASGGTRQQGSSRAFCGTAINCFLWVVLPFLNGIRYWKSLHNNTCQLLRYPPSYPPPSLFF